MRREGWIPKLTHLRKAGRGRVRIPAKGDVYLGAGGDWPADQQHPPESILRAYRHEVALWLESVASEPPAQRQAGSWLCRHVVSQYLASIKERPGHDTTRRALKPVLDLYGGTRAAEFDARAFCRCRDWHLSQGVRASAVNTYMQRIRTAFRWAARPEQRGVPPAVVAELSLVRALVDEEETPVEPVPRETVLAVLPHCPAIVAAMVRVQMLAGMRPGEVVQMTPGDLDRSGKCWLYRPGKYKSRRSAAVRQAGGRRVWLGPQAQLILLPWLDGKADDAPVFPSTRGRCYGVPGYRDAVHAACAAAGIPPFQPRQLRQTALTAVEEAFGSIDHAQAVGGHRRPDTTRRYAFGQDKLAREAMERLG